MYFKLISTYSIYWVEIIIGAVTLLQYPFLPYFMLQQVLQSCIHDQFIILVTIVGGAGGGRKIAFSLDFALFFSNTINH